MKTLLMAALLAAAILLLHEGGHALMAKGLGYEVEIGANSVRPVAGSYDGRGETMLVTMAGPIVTLLIGLVGAVLARITGSLTAFLVIFAAFLQRLAAQAISYVNPNDEMMVSTMLGIGRWTLPAAMTALLLVLLIWANRGTKAGPGRFLLAWAGASLGITALVIGEPYLPRLIW